MAKPNISLWGATYSGAAGVTLPKQGGGTATFPWVEGSETKTQNGTYDVSTLAEIVINVAGGGGASNVVKGSFTTGSSGGVVESVDIPYTGSGYPIALLVYVKGGPYNNGTGGNTDWYNSLQRYAIGLFAIVKSRTTTAPTYGTSGADNYGTVAVIYKNSTSQSTTYSRTSSMSVNSYTSSNANGTSTTAVRFKGNNGKTLSYYVASTSYGLLASTEYEYIAIYSS